MRQSTVASGLISCIYCSRGSHLEIWSIITSRPCIWQSFFQCPGVVCEYSYWFSVRCCLSLGRNARLDGEFMFCISTGRFLDQLHTSSTLSGLET